MGVSLNDGFSPEIINFNRVFHYKPSILGAHPYFRKYLYVIVDGMENQRAACGFVIFPELGLGFQTAPNCR